MEGDGERKKGKQVKTDNVESVDNMNVCLNVIDQNEENGEICVTSSWTWHRDDKKEKPNKGSLPFQCIHGAGNRISQAHTTTTFLYYRYITTVPLFLATRPHSIDFKEKQNESEQQIFEANHVSVCSLSTHSSSRRCLRQNVNMNQLGWLLLLSLIIWARCDDDHHQPRPPIELTPIKANGTSPIVVVEVEQDDDDQPEEDEAEEYLHSASSVEPTNGTVGGNDNLANGISIAQLFRSNPHLLPHLERLKASNPQLFQQPPSDGEQRQVFDTVLRRIVAGSINHTTQVISKQIPISVLKFLSF